MGTGAPQTFCDVRNVYTLGTDGHETFALVTSRFRFLSWLPVPLGLGKVVDTSCGGMLGPGCGTIKRCGLVE